MRKRSTLTEDQRIAVRALFEEGHGSDAVATHLRVGRDAVKRLSDLWRIRGGDALVTRATKQVFTFEIKCEVVRRFLTGETKVALAQEFGIAGPQTVSVWARIYRRDGEAGLWPKPKGRPRKDPDAPVPELSALEQLQQENESLRIKVAYLENSRP